MRPSFFSGLFSGLRSLGGPVPARARVALGILSLLCVFSVMVPAAAGAAEKNKQLSFGVDMAKRGLWSEALFRFGRADLADPNNPRILNNLAVANEAVGQFDEAMDLYRRAVELDPDNAELKRNYARFVEFYQGFRPRDESSEEEGSTEETEAPEDQADTREGVEDGDAG